MKKLIVILILMVVGVVFAADITLKLLVPNQYAARVLNAFTKAAGYQLEINIHGDPKDKGRHVYSYELKDPNETNKQFVSRAIRQYVKAMVIAVETNAEQERIESEIEAIDPVDVIVPDDIVSDQ